MITHEKDSKVINFGIPSDHSAIKIAFKFKNEKIIKLDIAEDQIQQYISIRDQ